MIKQSEIKSNVLTFKIYKEILTKLNECEKNDDKGKQKIFDDLLILMYDDINENNVNNLNFIERRYRLYYCIIENSCIKIDSTEMTKDNIIIKNTSLTVDVDDFVINFNIPKLNEKQDDDILNFIKAVVNISTGEIYKNTEIIKLFNETINMNLFKKVINIVKNKIIEINESVKIETKNNSFILSPENLFNLI